MIVGNGMMAKRFMECYKDDSSVIIFASGVSNSSEIDEDKYVRELSLINHCLSEYPHRKFVYFSSVIHLSGMKTRYLDHKREVERLLMNNSKNYLVIRLPQVVGPSGNKNNIINYFDSCVKNNIPLKVQTNTIRSIVDIDDVFNIVRRCIDREQNTILNLSHIEKIYVNELARFIFKLNNRPENIVDQPSGYSILSNNSPIIDEIIEQLNINRYNYTKRVLRKYITV